MRESGPIFSAPSDGYAVEREQRGRVLFSYDVDGRTKVAMFSAEGVRDWNGDEGWGVRAWGQCDPAELPSEVTDDLNTLRRSHAPRGCHRHRLASRRPAAVDRAG